MISMPSCQWLTAAEIQNRLFLTHQGLHELRQLFGDDCELLKGGPDVVRLVLPHDGGLAESVQRLREVHLTCHVTW